MMSMSQLRRLWKKQQRLEPGDRVTAMCGPRAGWLGLITRVAPPHPSDGSDRFEVRWLDNNETTLERMEFLKPR